jgi:hypothetical protein
MTRKLLLTVLAVSIASAFVASLSPGLFGIQKARAEGGDPCAAELAHGHGHLDFLKKVGDPASGDRTRGFGFVTFGTDEEARFGGVVIVQDSGPAGVAVVESGRCELVDGHLQLIVVLREVQSGDPVALIATTTERINGPGSYEADVFVAEGGPTAQGEIVLHLQPVP